MNAIRFEYNGVTRVALPIRPAGKESALCWQLSPKPGFRSFVATQCQNVATVPLDALDLDTVPILVKTQLLGSTYETYDDPYVNDWEGGR